jgi:hypothetical protein
MDRSGLAVEGDEDLGFGPAHESVGENVPLKILHVTLADPALGENTISEVLKRRVVHLLTPPRLYAAGLCSCCASTFAPPRLSSGKHRNLNPDSG